MEWLQAAPDRIRRRRMGRFKISFYDLDEASCAQFDSLKQRPSYRFSFETKAIAAFVSLPLILICASLSQWPINYGRATVELNRHAFPLGVDLKTRPLSNMKATDYLWYLKTAATHFWSGTVQQQERDRPAAAPCRIMLVKVVVTVWEWAVGRLWSESRTSHLIRALHFHRCCGQSTSPHLETSARQQKPLTIF